MLLLALEYMITAMLLVGWFTQVLLPVVKGTPMFPLFWSKEMKLRQKAKKLAQQIKEEKLQDSVEGMETEYDLSRRKTNTHSKEDNT